MSRSSFASHALAWLSTLATINLIASMILLGVVTATTLSGNSYFFEDSADLYGPMASNLRLMLVYVCLTEWAVMGYCRYRRRYAAVTLLGIFYLLLMVSLELYSSLNDVPVDDQYAVLFLYLGLSHLAFGGLDSLKTPSSETLS